MIVMRITYENAQFKYFGGKCMLHMQIDQLYLAYLTAKATTNRH